MDVRYLPAELMRDGDQSFGSGPTSKARDAAALAEAASASASVGNVLDDRAISLASEFRRIFQPKGSDAGPSRVM
jgi:hypothetical protein